MIFYFLIFPLVGLFDLIVYAKVLWLFKEFYFYFFFYEVLLGDLYLGAKGLFYLYVTGSSMFRHLFILESIPYKPFLISLLVIFGLFVKLTEAGEELRISSE